MGEAVPRIGKKTPVEQADEFAAQALVEIQAVTGQVPGVIVQGIVEVAAIQLATARHLFETGVRESDRQLTAAAGTLGNGARQNLISAHNLAVARAKHTAAADDEEDALQEFHMPKRPREAKGRPKAAVSRRK